MSTTTVQEWSCGQKVVGWIRRSDKELVKFSN